MFHPVSSGWGLGGVGLQGQVVELSCRSSDLGGRTQPEDGSAESNEVKGISEASGGLS